MKISHDLTDCGQYFMDIVLDPETGTLVAAARPGNPELSSKNLEENLKRLLKIEVDGKAYNAAANEGMIWPINDAASTQNIKIYIRDILFGEYEANPSDKTAYVLKRGDNLAPFELRTLARGIDSAIASQVPYDRSKLTSFTPKTDLHTHFAGNITVDDLITVGAKNGTQYPINLLQELGLRQSEDRSRISIDELRPAEIDRLKAAMAIPIERQTTFTDMERIYRFRSPIAKDINNFGDFLQTIATQYRKQGIQYAELSISDIVDPRYLKIAHDVLPGIEQQTGVQLRFLVGLWRHSDPEWNRYEVERIKLAAERSPYIVGADWMGQETNSTRAIADSFERLAEWAKENNPSFIFRIHAGENLFHAENVSAAAELAEKHGVKLRVGHGLYGVNSSTMDQLMKIGAIVEFNMNSNIALNNLDSSGVVPIQKYVRHGIQVVLGQDGQGIYHTSGRSEVLAASLAGLTSDDFARLSRIEWRYRQEQAENFANRSKMPMAFQIPALDEYPSREEADKKSAASAEATRQHRLALEAKIESIGVSLDTAHIENDTKGKTPVWLGLASMSSWPKINPAHQAEIVRTFELLVDCIDPTKAYFITGGENIGSAEIFHRIAQPRHQDGLVVMGATVAESFPEHFQENTITHASIVAKSWYDKAAAVAEMVRQRNGEAVFFGGGAVVGDEIATSANVGVGLHLMDGPEGASTQKARVFPDRAFKTGEMLIARLYDANPNIFDAEKVQSILSGAISSATADLPEFTLDEFGGLHKEGKLGQGFVTSQIQGSPRPIFFLDGPMTLHAHDGKGHFDNTRQLSTGAIVVFGGATSIAPLVQQVSSLIESGRTQTSEFQDAFSELKDRISKYANFYEYGDLNATLEAKRIQFSKATLGGVQALAEGKELSGNVIDGLGIQTEKWGHYFDELVAHFAREGRFIERTLPLQEREATARSLLTQALGETRSYPRALPPEAPTHPAYRFDGPIKIGEYHLPAGSWAVIIEDGQGNTTDLRPVSAINNGKTYTVVSGDPYYVNDVNMFKTAPLAVRNNPQVPDGLLVSPIIG